MLSAILDYQFMQNAIIAMIFASIVCGIIGVIIVEKKMVMLSGGIAHTSYGGVGLGYLMGFEPIIGAIIFSIISALGIGVVNKKAGKDSDIIIAMFWSIGMALGIIFIGLMPSYPPDMNSYLFGNILSVTKVDLIAMILMSIIIVLVTIILFNDWKAFLFDAEFSKLRGGGTNFLEFLLLILIALTVVVLIRIAGIILVIALLTAPAAIAKLFSNNLKNRMIISIILGMIICYVGLWISYNFNLASGATIVILSGIAYLIGYIISLKRNNFIERN